MNLEEIVKELAGAGPGSAADARRAEEAFAQAWRRAEEDPRERDRRVAQKVQVLVAGDMDGSQATETVSFPPAGLPLLRPRTSARWWR